VIKGLVSARSMRTLEGFRQKREEECGWPLGLGRFGDIDGDGQQDTFASHMCDFDYGDDGTTDLAYARVFVFDNTPGSSEPDVTADFLATLSNEDRSIGSLPTFSYQPWTEEFVDQNGDGIRNDIIITLGDRATFALSFSKGPSVKIQGKAGDLTGDNEITVADSVVAFQVSAGLEPPAAFDIEADVNGDGKISLEEILYVLQVLAEVKTVFGLGSDAFSYLGSMTSKYTADGQNVSPPLSWTYAPDETQTFVLICDDLDAPGVGWTHWIVYDIPAGRTSLAEGAGAQGGDSLPNGAHHGTNSWSNSYYQGPDPVSGVHRYAFTLHALDISQLNPAGTERAQIEAAMAGHILDQAQFVGTYAR
jgi:Raf kinase inhibitor-like YbhB/YbcL family protein